jgi:beta-glucosidase
VAEYRVSDLTLEEKASLTSGEDFWRTTPVERAGVPSIMVTDGPHGLRKQAGESDNLGLSQSVPATCFPPAVALGSSMDPDLAERIGEALGEECRIEDVAVLLGPAVNIKRSPLCGRNFEYISEDPLVAGAMGAGLVRGVQSQGVGTSLKHFAANNQETDRMRVSADIDPRPLREIYLRGFERVVRDAQPWTVMCSYNRINGVYASEDPWLLTQVLRDEWAFRGLVMSDWGAVNDRVAGLPAGLDLEMPASGGRTDAQLAAAVRAGALPESALNVAAQRVLDLVAKAQDRPGAAGPLDVEAHHALAREAAGRCVVLLRNDGGLLPLARETRVAVIGEFARTPRFQGGGSSHINPTRVDNALEEMRALAASGADGDAGATVSFAPGFTLDGTGDAAMLRREAVEAARAAEVAVVFLGLPEAEESEGFDRTTIDLPAVQLELLDAVVEANPRTVAILSNGGVVALPFRDRVPAIIEGWLLGQAGGGATADVLYGVVNPSGRLTETIPLRLEDTPSFGNFPGELGHVRYGEGILVGYRWFDAKGLEVAFPFGHGLSYTAFEYGPASVEVVGPQGAGDEGGAGDLLVTVPVRNTGTVAGREVVQAYASLTGPSAVARAPRELAGFASVELTAGETRNATIRIRREDLAYWDIRVGRWVVEGGDYLIEIGSSSRDLRSRVTATVPGDPIRPPLTRESSLSDLLADPVVGPRARREVLPAVGGEDMERMMGSIPIGRLASFTRGGLEETLEDLLSEARAGR